MADTYQIKTISAGKFTSSNIIPSSAGKFYI
jgi:hypothetical protein